MEDSAVCTSRHSQQPILAYSPVQPPASNAASEPVAPRTLEWRDLDKQKFVLYNPTIGLILRALQHPGVVVKTRLQMQKHQTLHSSASSVLMMTLRSEGIKGLYRGFGTASLQLIVSQIYIFTYEFLRARENFDSNMSESRRNAIAAAFAVLLAQVVANPIDVVAQKLMIQGQMVSNTPMPPRQASTATAVAPMAEGSAGSMSRTAATQSVLTQPMARMGAVDVLRQVVAQRGFWGLWNGFAISCAQFIPSASLWWSCYPVYRAHLLGPLSDAYAATRAALDKLEAKGASRSEGTGGGRQAKGRPAVEGSPLRPSGAHNSLLPWLPHDDAFHSQQLGAQAPDSWTGWSSLLPSAARLSEVLAGGMSSGTVAIAMNPLDIVRTRAQVEGVPAMAVARQLIAHEGVRGLWKGTSARLVMLIPQGMMSSTAYELVKRLSAKDTLGLDEPRLADDTALR